MKQQLDNFKEMKYYNIGLTELNAVISIYKKAKSKVSCDEYLFQNNTLPLTENFGLPLVFGKYGKKLIGFASVTLNPDNQVEINCYFR